jgi:predicted amidohydrolase
MDKEANLETFFSYMKEASAQGANLIVFPEAALQQNPCWGSDLLKPKQEELDYLRDSAETIPGESTAEVVAWAKDLDIHVVFGMTERDADGTLYSSSAFLGPKGLIGSCRQIHLWGADLWGNEPVYWQSGTETSVVDSPLGKVGLIVGTDLRWNLGVELAEKDPDLLVAVEAGKDGGGPAEEDYLNSCRRNALQAQRWLVVSNQVGKAGHIEMCGQSQVVGPDGEVMADTGKEEGMVVAETDLLVTL